MPRPKLSSTGLRRSALLLLVAIQISLLLVMFARFSRKDVEPKSFARSERNDTLTDVSIRTVHGIGSRGSTTLK